MAGRAWDEIRRALGRLVGTARVNRLEADQLRPPVAVRRAQAWDTTLVSAGQQEQTWPLAAQTRFLPAPTALPGGVNTDLAVVSTIISGNETLSMRPETGHAVPLNSSCRAQILPLPAPAQARVRTEPLSLPGKTLSRRAPLVPAPRLRALTQFTAGRAAIKSGLSLLAQAPLTRARSVPPPGESYSEAFAQERTHLAQATNTPEEDITLVGVYPNAPLSRARRLSVSAGGAALQLWLNLNMSKNGPPRLVTVVIGRQTSTGKALQTVLVPPPKGKNP